MVELLRIPAEKSHGREFCLLGVEILRFLKLEQRTQVVGLRRINDDDALALLELIDQVKAVNCRSDRHGHGDEEPEPRQPVPLREQLRRVKSLARRANAG